MTPRPWQIALRADARFDRSPFAATQAPAGSEPGVVLDQRTFGEDRRFRAELVATRCGLAIFIRDTAQDEVDFPGFAGELVTNIDERQPQPQTRGSMSTDDTMTSAEKPLRRVQCPILWHMVQGKNVPGRTSEMYGDCSRLSGNCTGLSGNCTGLIGNCTWLRGDCTELSGNCTELSGNCTGLSGDLDQIPMSARPCDIAEWVQDEEQ